MKKYLIIIAILAGSLHVSTQDAVRLGTDSGDGMLVDPRQIEEGPDGNIYVMDSRDWYIKVYSSEGKYIRHLAGKGEGPGMMKRAGGFSFTPDGKSLVFCEYWGGHPWLTVMELPDRFSRVIPLDLVKPFGVFRIEVAPDGSFLLLVEKTYTVEKEKDFFFYHTPSFFIRVSGEGELLKEVFHKTVVERMSFMQDGGDVGVPFSPHFFCRYYGRNKMIFSDGVQTRAEIYDFDGRMTGGINLEIPSPQQVTTRDLNEWRRDYKELLDNNPSWYQRFGSVIEKYTESIYKDLPVFSGFDITPEGNLLLNGEGEGKKLRYWLLSRQGKLLYQFQSKLQAVKLTKSYIFYLLSDEEEESDWFFKARNKGDIESLKSLISTFKR